MSTTAVVLTTTRKPQIEDLQDDRLLRHGLLGGTIVDDLDEFDDLDALVSATVSTGRPEISEIVMCAKCVGECKIF